MVLTKNKKLFVIFILSLFSLSLFLSVSTYQNSYIKIENQYKTISLFQNDDSEQFFKETHEDEQWIENSDFKSDDGWKSDVEGDIYDMGTEIEDGEANYFVLGDSGSQTIQGLPDNSWTRINNDLNKTLPRDTTTNYAYDIRANQGFWASHHWGEHVWQLAQVQWEKTITTDVDMSQYYITSASLEAWCNATVHADDGSSAISGDQSVPRGIDVPGDGPWYEAGREVQVGDYIKYYLKVTDINNLSRDEVSYFRTDSVRLGEDSAGPLDYLYDTKFEADEENLKFYLGEALKKNNQRFKIILGIEFFCEDDDQYDRDTFDSVYFKNFTLSFSYLKKIDDETTASWEYAGDKIDAKGGTVDINEAKLYFRHKINNPWLSTAPSSEFRISINNDIFKDSLTLLQSNSKFQDAKENGFDVTDLIPEDDEIDIAIQVYIGDEFGLDHNIMISIDDVELYITYDIYLSAEQSLLYQILFIIACCGIGSLVGYYIYYRKVLRYPKPVRKVRKYRKTLKKDKTPNVEVKGRDYALKAVYDSKTAKASSKIVPKSKEQKIPTTASLKNIKNSSKINNKALLILIFFLIGSMICPFLLFINPNNTQIQSYENTNKRVSLSLAQDFITDRWTTQSYAEQWIDNSDFQNNEDWWLFLDGDTSDMNGVISGGQANCYLYGETGRFNITETISQKWKRVNNPDNMSLPDSYEIRTGAGCFVSHRWEEDENQSVRVQWERNFTMPVDMSDYEITSASLIININGTVYANDGAGNPGGIEVYGDNPSYLNGGDYARYYGIISDLNKTREYIPTEYYTFDTLLGKNSAGQKESFNTTMEIDSEEELIFYLEQALKSDNYNFTLSLGINLWCEDNYGTDDDYFEALYIKNISLIFDYEKKMNKLNIIEWEYEGDEIDDEGGNVKIKNAEASFDFKIDSLWPSTSKKVQLRVLINGQQSGGSVLVSDAKTYLQEASSDGFDVTDLIPDDEDIKVAIQLLILNDFGLEDIYIISIDNVELDIEYDIVHRAEQSLIYLILLILACVGGGVLTTYIIYYQKVLKYPKPVRKVRKFRKRLNKTKTPDIAIISRENAIQTQFQSKSKILETIQKKEALAIKKQEDKLIQAQLKKTAEDLKR